MELKQIVSNGGFSIVSVYVTVYARFRSHQIQLLFLFINFMGCHCFFLCEISFNEITSIQLALRMTLHDPPTCIQSIASKILGELESHGHKMVIGNDLVTGKFEIKISLLIITPSVQTTLCFPSSNKYI